MAKKKRRRHARDYKQVIEGEWEPVVMRDDRLACCDCGLVHEVNYKRVRGKLMVQFWRDERATAQIRRGKRRQGTLVNLRPRAKT